MDQFDHRPELTGLRGVAVIAVLLFHAGGRGAANGYLGVDVFFVLSGFLIGSVLMVEYCNLETISLSHFYGRRVRRLLPAAAVTLLVTAAAFRFSFPPPTVMESRRCFVASACYVANWQQVADASDYWAEARGVEIRVNPVRHFWSLSVEEQFYYVFPLTCWLAQWAGGRRTLKGVLRVAGVASLAYSALLFWGGDVTASYMDTMARMYQLVAGALLAMKMQERRKEMRELPEKGSGGTPNGRPPTTLALVALAAVMASGILVRLPVFLGACLATSFSVVLLFSLEWERMTGGQEEESVSWGKLLLSCEPIVWLGDCSFSIYLWHYPFMVIAGEMGWLPGHRFGRAVVTLLGGVVLGAISRHAIEVPFARWITLDTRTMRLAVSAQALVAAAVLSVCLWLLLSPPVLLHGADSQVHGEGESSVSTGVERSVPMASLGAEEVGVPASKEPHGSAPGSLQVDQESDLTVNLSGQGEPIEAAGTTTVAHGIAVA